VPPAEGGGMEIIMQKIIKKLVSGVLSCLLLYTVNSFLGDKVKNIPEVLYCIILVVATFIVLILYDFLVMYVSIKLRDKFYDITVKNIENKKMKSALTYIKKNYLISLTDYYIRLYWVRLGCSETNEIYSYIRFSNFKYKMEGLMNLIFYPPVLISAAYVFVLKNNIMTYDFSFLLELTKISSAKLEFENTWKIIEKIPVIIAILPLLSIFYFVGNRNRIKSIVSKKENEKKKVVINKIFELSSYLEEYLYEISKNMETLIRNQNFIADKLLRSEIKNYYEISGQNNSVSMDLCYVFDEIEMADEIEKLVNELFCRDSMKYFEEFSFYSYRFRALYNFLSHDYAYYSKKNNKHGTSLCLLLNPYKYIQNILQISKDGDNYEKLLLEKISSFSPHIYNALELLLYIGLFVDEFNRFIKNSSAERLIKEVAEKGK